MEAVHDLHERVHAAIGWLDSRIVGQRRLVRRLVMALLCDGHLLVEGAPGLAKTRAIKELARTVEGSFHRIQFTPDLLPSDVTGTEVINTEDGSFTFRQGPVFHNLLLADEVNRAPAKVQAALLEAMAERQVSYGRETFPLPDLFLVMATQNPIEQEGTYPLPEAQLDRFLLHATVDYPDMASEREIMRIARAEQTERHPPDPPRPLSQVDIASARRAIVDIYVAPSVEEYIVALIDATRRDARLDYGASPARNDRPRPLRPGVRLARRTRFRDAGRRHRNRPRRPPPSPDPHVRCRGAGDRCRHGAGRSDRLGSGSVVSPRTSRR